MTTTKFCVLFVLAVLALENSTATITIDLPEGVTTFSAKIQELVAKHNTQPLFEELKKEVDVLLAQNDKDERLCRPKAQEFIAALVKDSQTDVEDCVNRSEAVAKDLQDKMAVISEEANTISKLLGEKIEECVKKPTKKVGGLLDINTSLISLKDLTNTALNHIESENTNKHVVLRIVEANQQVVAGMKYILLLEVAPTDCPKTVPELELDTCKLQKDKSQICKVEYYQRPWESKYANITSNNCTFSQEFNAEPTQQLVKVNNKKEICAGCPIDIEPNLESLNELTNTALNHIESENDYRHVVLRIIRAQTQVVAGIKYMLLLEVAPTDCPKTVAEPELNSCELLTDKSRVCKVTYYQKPWVSKYANIIGNNCTFSQEFNAEPTQQLVKVNNKKEICAGCPIDIEPNLESLNELANTALNHIESENDYRHVVLRIIRAQTQVVAGIKYILLLEVAPTDCPKTVAEPELNSCELLSDKSRVCEVTYYQKPWVSKYANIIGNNCTFSQEFNAEPTQQLVKVNNNKETYAGSPIDIDPNLESLNELTNTALNHIESENDYRHVVLRIIRAQEQVVAGIKYILLLEVAPTDCPKTVAEPELNSCELLTDKSRVCEVTYYQKPWVSKYANIIRNNCTFSQEFNAEPTQQLVKVNNKKEICAGCPIDIEPNLESLNELTNTALNHIESENDYRHVVLRIIRAQSQVVAGIKYMLLLEVAPTDCPKTVADPEINSCELLTDKSRVCEIEYYQKPWVSKHANIISNNCTYSQEFNAEPVNKQNQRNIFGFVDCVEENTKDLQEKLEDLELQMIQMSYLALQNGKEALKELDVCLAKTENKVTLDGRAIVSGLNQCVQNVDLLYSLPSEETSVDAVITELKKEVEDLLVLGERIERLCGPKAHDLIEALSQEVQTDAKQCSVKYSTNVEQFNLCLSKAENKATIQGRAIVSGVNQCIQNVGMLYLRMWSEDISDIVYKHNVEALVEGLKKDVDHLLISEKYERFCGPKTHENIDQLFEDSLLNVDKCLATMSSPLALKELENCLEKVENKVTLEGRTIISGLNQCIRNADLLF